MIAEPSEKSHGNQHFDIPFLHPRRKKVYFIGNYMFWCPRHEFPSLSDPPIEAQHYDQGFGSLKTNL